MRILAHALEAIHEHCVAAYPHECCGALIGSRDGTTPSSVDAAWPLANADRNAPEHRYLVTAETYRRLEARADRDGVTVIGFYHSHPDAPARPSSIDLDEAWPNFSYIIVSVASGRAAATSAWRLADDRGSMVHEELSCQPGS